MTGCLRSCTGAARLQANHADLLTPTQTTSTCIEGSGQSNSHAAQHPSSLPDCAHRLEKCQTYTKQVGVKATSPTPQSCTQTQYQHARRQQPQEHRELLPCMISTHTHQNSTQILPVLLHMPHLSCQELSKSPLQESHVKVWSTLQCGMAPAHQHTSQHHSPMRNSRRCCTLKKVGVRIDRIAAKALRCRTAVASLPYHGLLNGHCQACPTDRLAGGRLGRTSFASSSRLRRCQTLRLHCLAKQRLLLANHRQHWAQVLGQQGQPHQ